MRINLKILIVLILGFLCLANLAYAANCGDTNSDGVTETTCACGDTVIGAEGYTYTLPANLTCTGDGLTVGAGDITIDGNSHTIDGDDDNGDYGILNNAKANVSIVNLTITDFYVGVAYYSVEGGTIDGNNVSSCADGIQLWDSYSVNVDDNIVNDNNRGILLDESSTLNVFTGNTMSGNINSIFVNATTSTDYDNDIDTSNKVEGKSVYYLYDNDGTSETPLVYDGDVIGDDISMFWCISCDYVQIKNANLVKNNLYSVFFYDTRNSLIENIVTAPDVQYGIYLNASSSNTIRGNITSSGVYGIYLYSSSSNTLVNNNSSYNVYDLYSASSTNTYTSNHFVHNINSKMFTYTEPTRIYNIGDTINFSVRSFNINGTACTNCITSNVYPSETIMQDNTWSSTNNPQGHFMATKSGTYSVVFTITDSNLNETKRALKFIVGENTQETTSRYYYRGVNPIHGQGFGNSHDSKSLYLSPSETSEMWYCSGWVQNYIDNIPSTYTLSMLSNISASTWYKSSGTAIIGIQRYSTYDATSLYQSDSFDSSEKYTWSGLKSFDLSALGGDWIMDYRHNWYRLVLKLRADNVFQVTYPASESEADATSWATYCPGGACESSYADFTYSYTTTPAVKSISNDDVNVLSATAPTTDTDDATIVLDYPLSGTASANIVLGDPDNSHPFRRPFQGYTTTINSNGTVTLAATGLTSTATTIGSVPMDIAPDVGTINVSITTWNTSGTYSKEWTETGTGTISVSHTVGDLEANTHYVVSVDGKILGTYLADADGQIAFNYLGEYSTHTFSLTKSSAPVGGNSLALISQSQPPAQQQVLPVTIIEETQTPLTKEETISQLKQQLIQLLTQVIQMLMQQIAEMEK